MNYSAQTKLIRYLRDELLIPADAIALAIRQQHHLSSQLPIILWQFGFVSLKQLNQVFEWLERTESSNKVGASPAT
ncbi:DUF2949 domain-containing protein [Acaryochloris sp. 'Moss Beach']|uniref:DUF2949 domain-containing protein n=1 Tax=Acaryochloris TaxID=155977 RepID=UPI001BB060BA|nr:MULTISPECIES: DUF2949 domain-containing protein [Acaryochloris]QUY43886.1 DUF2949 domain-containing protein [Acaryochloris marina S15]UJB68663.1 DUF2949 domain-containing protein [Acaryochloris sp. 'Moss Beach']